MRALIGLFFALIGGAAQAHEPICRAVTFETVAHIVCDVTREADIRLSLRDDAGDVLGGFEPMQDAFRSDLRMAMNGGMYHSDRDPVGLYVEEGRALAPLVTSPGPGNFGLTPNGVFWSDGQVVHVTETLAFEALDIAPVFATQSGPMLVIDGELQPRFLPDSPSRKRRNGVGIADDRVVFAISDAPVTFHHFARLFRDELGADNALFLDGSISRIYAPDLDRDERGGRLGPMIAVVESEGGARLR